MREITVAAIDIAEGSGLHDQLFEFD
jgi:hypothetical protein